MPTEVSCPVCLSRDGYNCIRDAFGGRDADQFDCEVCGHFVVSRQALVTVLHADHPALRPLVRAALSHSIRLQNDAGNPPDMLTTDSVDAFIAGKPSLPSPAEQATNLIRYVGDRFQESGEPLETLPPSLSASIGSPNRDFAFGLVAELNRRGLIVGYEVSDVNLPSQMQSVSLTLAGWEIFEREQQGQAPGTHGFIALKFGDPILDPLVKDHMKPAIAALGYTLVDMRDVARAGVIDNLLRIQIRDAAFVLVDLTHENAGAYWEAGYAEGLGKPVLYICERSKFDQKRTHFDTNHCTTVLWDAEATSQFLEDLIATLKRSLNI